MKGKEAQALYYCDIGMWLWHYLSAIIKLKVDVWCGCEGWHNAEGVCLETDRGCSSDPADPPQESFHSYRT